MTGYAPAQSSCHWTRRYADQVRNVERARANRLSPNLPFVIIGWKRVDERIEFGPRVGSQRRADPIEGNNERDNGMR